MAGQLTRRDALKAGAVTAGLALGSSCGKTGQEQNAQVTPPVKEFWEPGPDKNLVRDLKPGTTPIRLGGYLGKNEKESLAVTVKKIKDAGGKAVVTSKEQR